ncbi:Riboflavin transporter [Paraurantiacibacter namhicola]|uniref:Riboflavin transporter n=2 Tax=Paraurantiacibacter namhicola TaxID=645517 RepID=A0A1C7D7V4_9SPHN|nr:Riboflavin transporter [Paraurantiacibacter namhicola]
MLYVLAGVTVLTVGDAIFKSMAGEWGAAGVAALRYTMGAVGLSAILLARGGRSELLHWPRPRLQWMRGFGVALATVAIINAFFLMPLAEATAITFTQPMITALLAALFLGERMRAAVLVATVVGFIGVTIVLRPNFMDIGFAAFLPLLAALGMAILIIGNRASAGLASSLAMQAYVAITATVFLLAAAGLGMLSGHPAWQLDMPHWSVVLRCAVVAVTASFAHWLIFIGTVRAGASTVAPMTYGQLIAASILGYIFFDEIPDAMAWLGAAIIVGAGLFLWWQGRAAPAAGTQR